MKIQKIIFTTVLFLLCAAGFAEAQTERLLEEQSSVLEKTYICDCISNEDNSIYLMRTIYEPDWRMSIYAFVNGRYNADIKIHLLWDKAVAAGSIRGLVFSPYSNSFYFTSAWTMEEDSEPDTSGLWRVIQSNKNDVTSLQLFHEFIPIGIGYLIVNKKGVWLLQDVAHFEIGEGWTSSELYQIEDEKGNYLFKKIETKEQSFHSFDLFETRRDQFTDRPDVKYEMNINFQNTDYTLLICDKDEKSWWVYDCITGKAIKYESHELAYQAALAIDIAQETKLNRGQLKETPVQFVLQLLAIVCFFVIVIFIILIILQKKKQSKLAVTSLIERNKMIFDIQEKERAKISRDIHDSVVQDIRVLRLETENLVVEEDSKQQQAKIADLATDCILKLRNICYNLAPAELTSHTEGDSTKVELISIINSLVQQFSSRTHIPCVFKVDEGFEYPVLEKEKTQNLFRVVQEALTNIEKHSYATKASIFMKKDGESLLIYVTDDGIGCNQNELDKKMNSKEHLGLRSMKDRMELIGGSIEFFTSQNDGMEIKIELPLEKHGTEGNV